MLFICNMEVFKYKKAVQALNFCAVKSGGSINKMKAIKLIWLSDRYHLRKYGRTITGDHYFAMPKGPVASNVRDLLEGNSFGKDKDEIIYTNCYIRAQRYDFSTLKHIEEKVFSKTDIEALKLIFETYNNYSKYELSSLSHTFPEWLKQKEELKIARRSDININDFFENVDDGKGLFIDDSDFLEISQKMFNLNL